MKRYLTFCVFCLSLLWGARCWADVVKTGIFSYEREVGNITVDTSGGWYYETPGGLVSGFYLDGSSVINGSGTGAYKFLAYDGSHVYGCNTNAWQTHALPFSDTFACGLVSATSVVDFIFAATDSGSENVLLAYLNNEGAAPANYALAYWSAVSSSPPLPFFEQQEGTENSNYESDRDFMEPLAPPVSPCSVAGNDYEIYGWINTSTTTDALYYTYDDPDALGQLGPNVNLMRLKLERNVSGSWLTITDEMYPFQKAAHTGYWRYDYTFIPKLARNDIDGDYRYSLSRCFWTAESGVSPVCSLPEVYQKPFTINEKEFQECQGDAVGLTTSTPYFVNLALQIGKALFESRWSAVQFRSIINNVTSTLPISYWWQMKSAVSEAATVTSTFAIEIRTPIIDNSGWSATSVNVTAAFTSGLGADLEEATKERVYRYLGYLYDLLYLGFGIFMIFGVFGFRLPGIQMIVTRRTPETVVGIGGENDYAKYSYTRGFDNFHKRNRFK